MLKLMDELSVARGYRAVASIAKGGGIELKKPNRSLRWVFVKTHKYTKRNW